MKNVKKVLILAVALALAFTGVASANICTVQGVGSAGSTSSVLINCTPDVNYTRGDAISLKGTLGTNECSVNQMSSNDSISVVLLTCGPTLLVQGNTVEVQ